MAGTVTVTGKIGPAQAVTASVFNNVSLFSIDCNGNILTIVQGSLTTKIEITAATTITATKSSSTYTVTIS